MGVEAYTRVWEHAPHDGTRLVLLLALADPANAAGVCWPGQATLLLYTRLRDARTIRRYLQDLVASGDLYIGSGDGWNVRTRYFITTALPADEIEQVLSGYPFELPLDQAQRIAAAIVTRQAVACEKFAIPLDELRKNKRRSPVLGRRRSAPSGGAPQAPQPAGDGRGDSPIHPSPASGGNRSPKGGANDPDRRGKRLTPGGGDDPAWQGQTIPTKAEYGAPPSTETRSDPTTNHHHDPSHDPPTTGTGGVGVLSATETYLLAQGFNPTVAAEFRHYPLERVRAFVEEKRRLGYTQNGGIVTAMRRQRQHLAPSDQRTTAAPPAPPRRDWKAEARAVAPPGTPEFDLIRLALVLKSGADPQQVLADLAGMTATAHPTGDAA